MAKILLKHCAVCDDYTLQDICPRCGGDARPNRPAKYSPEDPYGDYRRRLKKQDRATGAAEPGSAEGVP